MPILFLTAKAKESDKLIGFMAGGDDYLTKPFSYAELLGRVKALLRRYHQYQGKNAVEGKKVEEYLEMEEIRINQQYNEVQVRGEKIELSNIEYHILLLLMQNPKKYFLPRICMRAFGMNRIFIIATVQSWYISANCG